MYSKTDDETKLWKNSAAKLSKNNVQIKAICS